MSPEPHQDSGHICSPSPGALGPGPAGAVESGTEAAVQAHASESADFTAGRWPPSRPRKVARWPYQSPWHLAQLASLAVVVLQWACQALRCCRHGPRDGWASASRAVRGVCGGRERGIGGT